jgi:pimeloyl-ACP methyl ester carboxylesterase
MATPRLERFRLAGTLGEILVDVRSGNRRIPLPVVVLVHGFKGFKDWGFFPLLADRLARAGFAVVSYNASGSGVDDSGTVVHPDRFGRNTFSAELADLDAVLDAVTAGALGLPAPTSIGLLGHSRGGGMAILAAAKRAEVKALVTWAAIASTARWSEEMRRRWRAQGHLEVRNQRTGQVLPLYPDILDDLDRNAETLDIGRAASRLTIPWLLAHGMVDETVKLSEAESLAAAAPSAEPLFLPQTGHTFGTSHPLTDRPPAFASLLDASVGFMSRHLT